MVRTVLSPHTPGPTLQGFNVNLVTTDRVSALHEACLGGHVACAKVLLENGAQVSPGDASGDMGTWRMDTPCINGDVRRAVHVAGPRCRWTSQTEMWKDNSVLFPWVIDLFPPCIIPLFSFVFPLCVKHSHG